MKDYKVALGHGKFALVDKEDVLHLCQWDWKLSFDGYAIRTERVDGKYRTISMYCVILERKLGHNDFEECDHINRIKLDDHRDNLQSVTHQQNQWNRDKYRNNTSGYIGVSWHERNKKWQAHIRVDSKKKHLGYSDSKIIAARIRDLAAIKYHGEHAVLNFPKSDYQNHIKTRKLEKII